jgi:hypothetical protein
LADHSRKEGRNEGSNLVGSIIHAKEARKEECDEEKTLKP